MHEMETENPAQRSTDLTPIAIIGGGVIGLSIARRLALSGAKVRLFERGRCGSGASAAAAGMLAAGTEAEPGEQALVALGLRSQTLWPDFADALGRESGIDVDLREQGTLTVALTRDDVGRLEQAMRIRRSAGVETIWLDRRALRSREPLLAPGVQGALYCPGDHQVDNRRVTEALIAACRQAGVDIVEETPIDELMVERGRLVGLRSESTVHRCDVAVVACGAWSAQRLLPDLPVRPVKGQSLALAMDAARPLLQHVVWGPSIYLAPKSDGRLILGATVEEAGFDDRLTAGGMLSVLEAAWRLLPAIEELPILDSWAGFRPGSRDDAPLLGPVGPDGLVVATGHHRNGFLLAPVTAELIADYILSGRRDAMLDEFSADRFTGAMPRKQSA